MALASSLLIFAGSPQAFLGVASAQESLFVLIDIFPAYAKQLRCDLERTLIEFSSVIATPLAKLRGLASRCKRHEGLICG
jgi:hypothetical protein